MSGQESEELIAESLITQGFRLAGPPIQLPAELEKDKLRALHAQGVEQRRLARNQERSFGRPREVNRNVGIDQELAALCGGNSHPEYPFLRVGYSPTSRYPAADFTPWIARKLQARRFEDIARLMGALTQANPEFGPGPSYWHVFATQLCHLDLQKLLTFHDQRAYVDLKSALFPYALHGALNGFIIVAREVEYLVRAISPYPFSVPDLESKVSAANAFIQKMRRETKDARTAWTELPFYDHEAVLSALCAEAPAPALRASLREATVSARQVFFGTLLEGAGQGAWSARPFGVNEGAASEELVSLGLGFLLEDPFLVLMGLKKDELLAALARGSPYEARLVQEVHHQIPDERNARSR